MFPDLRALPGSNHIHFANLGATTLLGKVMNPSLTKHHPPHVEIPQTERFRVTAVEAANKEGWNTPYSGGGDHHHQVIRLQTLKTNGRAELKVKVWSRTCWRITACAQENLLLCLVVCC